MTQIISQLASSDPASAFGTNTLPNFDFVTGEWWFGGSLAASRVNSITGVEAAVFSAEPIWQQGFATMQSGGVGAQRGLTTDAPITPSMSFVALVRRYGLEDGTILVPSDESTSFNMLTYQGDVSHGNGHQIGATDQSRLPLAPAPAFTFYMGVAVLAQPSRLYKVTQAGTTMDDGGGLYLPTSRPAGTVRIGGGTNVNFAGRVDVAALAVLSDAMPQSYAETLYPMWKGYAESRGLTVA